MSYIGGVDESGKGDFFGPLVVAAAAISDIEKPLLEELYVRDSKKLTDQRVLVVAKRLRENIPYSVVVAMPVKYNEIYLQTANLNILLARGHARAIEDLLEKVACEKVISDRFAKEEVLERALLEKGRQVELIQQTKGESELPVAAASILARAEFVRCMEQLSRTWKMELPKGASSLVDQAGKRFIEMHGEDNLKQVAKLHFKNLKKIRELASRLL